MQYMLYYNITILIYQRKKNSYWRFALIPEEKDETQYNVLHKKILNGFKLVDKRNEPRQLWTECENKNILKYANKEGSSSFVLMKQDDISEARENIDALDFFVHKLKKMAFLKLIIFKFWGKIHIAIK